MQRQILRQHTLKDELLLHYLFGASFPHEMVPTSANRSLMNKVASMYPTKVTMKIGSETAEMQTEHLCNFAAFRSVLMQRW